MRRGSLSSVHSGFRAFAFQVGFGTATASDVGHPCKDRVCPLAMGGVVAVSAFEQQVEADAALLQPWERATTFGCMYKNDGGKMDPGTDGLPDLFDLGVTQEVRRIVV